MNRASSLSDRNPRPPRLLMVGWDAADWKIASPLVDRGELPNLKKLIEAGTMADLTTMQPPLSPMLWTTIATGHRPDRHGILGFVELDETSAVRSSSSLSRRCKALWNIATQAGREVRVVNWLASHPAEPINGLCISDALTQGIEKETIPDLATGSVHPASRQAEFAELRVSVYEIDEETISLFVPRMAEVDQDKDRRLAVIAKLISETLTVHQAALAALEGNWDFAAVYYPGIDHFSHGFVNFHPPAPSWVDPHLAALYGDVVNSAYRLHDLLLGKLLAAAGPDTAVMLLSDHGFHSDHLRKRETPKVPSGPTTHHRDHGVLVMTGPGIKADGLIHGVSLLDIAPTALVMMGLPVGEDMPGRVLAEAFDPAPRYRTVPSWEDEPGEAGQHGADARMDPDETSMLMEQFAALGYLDAAEMGDQGAPDAVRREMDWNLARAQIDAGTPEVAIPVLERLCAAWPERSDFGLTLCDALCTIGANDEAQELAEAMLFHQRQHPRMSYIRGIISAAKGESAEALEHLRTAAEVQAGRPELHVQIGFAALRLKDLPLAERSFARAMALDPHFAPARTGLAAVAADKWDWDAAEEHALAAIKINFQSPSAHMLLAEIHLRQKRFPDADLALQVACRIAPDWVPPREMRARMWAGVPGHPNTAATAADLTTAAARAEERAARRAASRDAAHESARRLLLQTYMALGEADAQSDSEEENPAEKADNAPLDIVLVSGLPRSGTSLVMQMLARGGAPLLTDGVRTPDEDNPEGYLEWRPLMRLPKHPELLRSARGKVLKLLTPMLPYLPRRHRYRVLFLDRPIEEVMASQRAMRTRLGRPTPADPAKLRSALATHRTEALARLRDVLGSAVLVVPYPELVADPTEWSNRIAAFLGPDMVPQPDQMPGAVRSALHRQRRET